MFEFYENDDPSFPLITNDDTEENTDTEIAGYNKDKLQDVPIVTYLRECIESGFKLIILFYIMSSFMFLLCDSASALDIAYTSNIIIDISVVNINVFNLFVVVVSIANLCVTKHQRNPQMENEKSQLLFYGIMLPIGIWAVIYIIVYTWFVNEGRLCVYNSFSRYLSFTEVLIIVFSLINVENNLKIRGSHLPWLEKSLNRFTNSLYVVAYIKMFLFYISTRINFEFIKNAQHFFNITFNISQACPEMFQSDRKIMVYFIEFVLPIGVPLFAVLAGVTLIARDTGAIDRPPNTRFVFSSIASAILCVIIAFSVVGHLLIYLTQIALSHDTFLKWHVNINYKIAMLSIKAIIGIIGIVAVKIKIKEVVSWPRIETLEYSMNFFDRAFIWFGIFGQLFAFVQHVSFIAYEMREYFKDLMDQGHHDSSYLVLLILLCPTSLFTVIHALYQTCLIEICLDRRWGNATHQQTITTRRFYPAFVLMFINLSDFFMYNYSGLIITGSLSTNNMLMTLFTRTAYFTSQSACMLQYLHGVLYFFLLTKVTEFKAVVQQDTLNSITI